MKEVVKEQLIIWSIVGSFISFLIGAIEAGIADKCAHESILSRITVPYVIGCELLKKRWE